MNLFLLCFSVSSEFVEQINCTVAPLQLIRKVRLLLAVRTSNQMFLLPGFGRFFYVRVCALCGG